MSMKKLSVLCLVLFVLATILSGCSNGIRTSSGEQVTLYILYIDDLPAEQSYVKKQIDFWIKPEIKRIFTDGGYKVKMIGSRDEFDSGPGSYLLTTTLVAYKYRVFRPSSVTQHTLTSRYEFSDQSVGQLLKYEDTAKSVANWKKCALKLNRDALNKVTHKIKEILQTG